MLDRLLLHTAFDVDKKLQTIRESIRQEFPYRHRLVRARLLGYMSEEHGPKLYVPTNAPMMLPFRIEGDVEKKLRIYAHFAERTEKGRFKEYQDTIQR